MIKQKWLWAFCVLTFAACDRLGLPPQPASPRETTSGLPRSASDTPGAQRATSACGQLPTAAELKRLLSESPNSVEAGGLFSGRMEWAAIVNRAGVLCALVVATEDAAAAWPGSRTIAIAKASTANAFSTDSLPMSTARLYTFSQPGHSLWGIANGNPLNPACLSTPGDTAAIGKICGGTIAFGGGVPLYRGQTRVGGLGVSGDTSCADHEIAKRIRSAAGLDPAKGAAVDDIQYTKVDGATPFAHPLCPNTWRDGKKIGDESPGAGY